MPMLSIHLTSFPVLTTERLVLRELRLSDAEPVFAMRSDPVVMRHVNRPLAANMDDALALIELINSRGAAGESVQWAITLKGDDTFIGLIGFWRLVKEHHYAELGYTLMQAHWGQGYISEAVSAVVDHGFGSLGFHRIQAITRPQNLASMRVLEKNGFQREGHFRQDVLSDGVFLDSVYFARLAAPSV
jgi:ribosomal-protein-alanine N-acetyltransferase